MEPTPLGPFGTLGLTDAATVGEVRQAFLALVKQVHPDAGGDSAEFQALWTAYQQAKAQARPGPAPRPRRRDRPYAWFVEGPWLEPASAPGTASPRRPVAPVSRGLQEVDDAGHAAAFARLLDAELSRTSAAS